MHLGDSQGDAEWESATDQAAEFVYGVAFTPAARILEARMPTSHEKPTGSDKQSQVQSYHILSLGAGGNSTVADAIRLARIDVINLWRHGVPAACDATAASPTNRTAILNSFAPAANGLETLAASAVKQQFTLFALEMSDLLADAAEVVKLEVGEDEETFVSTLIDDCLSATPDKPAGHERATTILAMLDRFLQAEFQEGREEPADDQLFTKMAGRLAVRTRGRINSLLDWIRNFVNSPNVRIEGARKHAVAAQQLLQTLHENALTQASELHKSLIEIGMTAQSDELLRPERARFVGWRLRRKKPDDKFRECVKSYAETSLAELLHRAVAKVSRMVVSEVSILIEQLDRLSRDLNRLAGPTQGLSQGVRNARHESDEDLPEGSARELVAYRQLLREQLRIRRQDIARQVDAVIEWQLLRNGQGIRTFLDSEAELQRLLGRPLDDASRQTVLACIQEINAQLVEACSSPSECQAMRDLGALIAAALAPAAEECRADVVERVLIIPDEANARALRTILSSRPLSASIVQGPQCDITLCNIRRPASLASTAHEIIGGVELYKDLADRLHTRVDLTWRPFQRAQAAADASPFGSLGSIESPKPTHTVVLPLPQETVAASPIPESCVGAFAVHVGMQSDA